MCIFFFCFFYKFLVFEAAIFANKDVYIIFGGRLIPWFLGSAASVELAHSLAHEVDVTRRCCLSLGEVQRVCSPRGGDLLCRPRTTKRSVQLTSVSQVDRACSTHATILEYNRINIVTDLHCQRSFENSNLTTPVANVISFVYGDYFM